MLLFDSGRIVEAEAALRRAVAEGENTSDAHAMIGLCLLKSGFTGDAKTEVETALRLDPNNAYAHYAHSFSLQSSLAFVQTPFFGRRPTDVIQVRQLRAAARQAVELDSRNPRYLCRLAHVHQILGEWRKSLEPAEQALSIAPDHLPAAVLRAEALSRIGKLGEARATLQRALEFNPEAFAAHAGMGWVLLRAGDYRRATEFFDEALRLNARSQPAQTGALECAKHRYRVYRWLVYLQQWLDGLHLLLRVPVVIAMAAGILAALIGLFYLFNQFFRPVLGAKAAGLLAVSLFSGLIGLVIFHGQIFNWLVRHNRAAKLEANEKRRRLSNRSLMTFCAGIFGGIGFSVLQYWLPNLQVVLAGLIPGGFALVIAWTQLPPGKTRTGWLVYAGAVLAVGPVVAVLFQDFFRQCSSPAILAFLAVPFLPLFVKAEHCKKLERERKHKESVRIAGERLGK